MAYYESMNVAIVGFATEGRVSAEYWASLGYAVTVCDRNDAIDVPAAYEKQLGDDYLRDLDRFDVIVRSAGINPNVLLADNPTIGPKITTAINEFLRACPTKNTIGITGTKGKGTTSTLTTKMLEAAGKKVWLGGNIGRSPLEFIDEIKLDDWVVLELSSYQLSDLEYAAHIAACLLVVPEHLDWHEDVPDYIRAKKRLFEHQAADDLAIYYAESENSHGIALASPGQHIPYYQSPGAYVSNGAICIDNQIICKTAELKLIGKHNWQNACAATTIAWNAGIRDVPALRTALQNFSGLPHRIEYLRTVDGISYYNDSFATGLHATTAAVAAINEPKVMILGGHDRMLPLEDFTYFVSENQSTIRTLLIIGASAERLAAALDDAEYSNYVIDSESKTMPAIVAHAQKLAQPGDAIVLSPGFASFGLFNNFEERGNLFRAVVEAL